RDGDGVAQPAAGQRVQGLPGRTRGHRRRPGRPDRAALRQRDRRGDRRRRAGRRRASLRRARRANRGHAGGAGHRRARRLRDARDAARARGRRPRRAGRAHPAARRGRRARGARAARGRLHRRHGRGRAGGAGPRLPHGRLPQPRGAGCARPRAGDRAPVRRRRRGGHRPGRRPRLGRLPAPRAEGGRRPLSGAEGGALLGELIGSSAAGTGATLACSVVSSRLLAAIAARHGLEFRATLTGFKWIARVPGLDFGYEEALGYCVDPAAVRDKDGITAALLIVTHAARLRSIGRSLLDALDDIARAYGVYATGQLSVRVADLSLIGAAMSRLRQAPPTTLGGSAVVRTLDLSEGTEELPPTDGLLYETADRSRVIVRPSGTEPKLKCYLEVIADVAHDADDARLAEVRAQAA